MISDAKPAQHRMCDNAAQTKIFSAMMMCVVFLNSTGLLGVGLKDSILSNWFNVCKAPVGDFVYIGNWSPEQKSGLVWMPSSASEGRLRMQADRGEYGDSEDAVPALGEFGTPRTASLQLNNAGYTAAGACAGRNAS